MCATYELTVVYVYVNSRHTASPDIVYCRQERGVDEAMRSHIFIRTDTRRIHASSEASAPVQGLKLIAGSTPCSFTPCINNHVRDLTRALNLAFWTPHPGQNGELTNSVKFTFLSVLVLPNYPVRACAAGSSVWSIVSVCMYFYPALRGRKRG